MTNSFNPILDTYAKGKIDTINFDMDFDKISIDITRHEFDDNAQIVFEDVKAFYFIDHDLITELELSDKNLNVISYDTLGFGEFTAVDTRSSDDLFVSVPNFAVNINNSSLYIDAHRIRINDKEYSVKY